MTRWYDNQATGSLYNPNMPKTEVSPDRRTLVSEHVTPGNTPPAPEYLPSIELREFVSSRCGANDMSTGTATFSPGAVLPYHVHPFGEAITIISGVAQISVEGRMYRLNPFDCIHLPAGTPHRVTNPSPAERLTAHWAFATGHPVRELVADRFRESDRQFECCQTWRARVRETIRHPRSLPACGWNTFLRSFWRAFRGARNMRRLWRV